MEKMSVTIMKNQEKIIENKAARAKVRLLAEVICGVVVFHLVKRFFYEDSACLDPDSSHFNSLFAVAKRLERLYHGSRVYVGLRIPDPDSASRRNIDLVLVTKEEAVVIAVKDLSGYVSIDKDDNWVCIDGKNHKPELLPDPVGETKQLATILEEYLEQRGVVLPEGYLSWKVICPNPNFRSLLSDSFPPEVITYEQWTKLKPEQNILCSEWILGVLVGGKKKMHESFSDKLNFALSTAPIWDKLELKGSKCILGEFVEFKGKQDDLLALRKIKRSKVSRLAIEKIGLFSFVNLYRISIPAQSIVRLLYFPRDYRVEGASCSSFNCEDVSVRSSTEVVFQPQNCAQSRKYKLSSVISMSLSA